MNINLSSELTTLRELVLDQDIVEIPTDLIYGAFGLDTNTYKLLDLNSFVIIFNLAKKVFIDQYRICGNPKLIHSVDATDYVKEIVDQLIHSGAYFNPVPLFNVTLGHDVVEDDKDNYKSELNTMVERGVFSIDQYLAIRALTKNDQVFHPQKKEVIKYETEPERYLENYADYLRGLLDVNILEYNLTKATENHNMSFPLPPNTNLDVISLEDIALLGCAAKSGDALDNINTATSLRNSIYVPLRIHEPRYEIENGSIINRNMHFEDYIKQIRKSSIVLEFLGEYISNSDEDPIKYQLTSALVIKLYEDTVEELEKEIRRTEVELDDTKDHKDKIEELKSMIPPNIRLSVMKRRYDWALNLLHGDTNYMTPELNDALLFHLETVQGVLENVRKRRGKRMSVFKERSLLSY